MPRRLFAAAALSAASRGVGQSTAPLVAILEHSAEYEDSADDTISRNLDIYTEQLREAASRGARVLVTPEYGITGYGWRDREEWREYAVDLPAPPPDSGRRWVPCEEGRADVGGGGPPTPAILRRLSCMARDSGVTLVANLVDVKDCFYQPSPPECRASGAGVALFNTDVVLDSDGAYIAKYHKANLWGEQPIDAATTCEPATFVPRALGITFGIFTCADLIWSWPSLALVRQGVRHFVMPLAWSNEMAQMQALGWLQAWSRVANATLLAANGRDPGRETGSGIFSRGEPVAYAYDTGAGAGSSGAPRQLVVAPLPVLDAMVPPPASICGRPTPAGAGVDCGARDTSGASVGRLRRGGDGHGPPADVHAAGVDEWRGAGWRFLRLDMSPGYHEASLCVPRLGGELCCQLQYESAATGLGFALAAVAGEDAYSGVRAWTAEACAVLPCSRGAPVNDCLEYPGEALQQGPAAFGAFASLRLRANTSAGAVAYPVAEAYPERALPRERLHFVNTADGQELSVDGLDKDLLLVSAEIYARDFQRDRPRPACLCQPESRAQVSME